jgi:hypothetical protein
VGVSLLIVGFAVGSEEGIAVGNAVVGLKVGTELDILDVGEGVGALDGSALVIGACVGAYVTSCTPAPATTAVPEHVDEPVQPS